MNSQDALVVLKILSINLQKEKVDQDAPAIEQLLAQLEIDCLANALGLVRLEVVGSLERLRVAGLIFSHQDTSIKANKYALMGLARFGFRHLFPVSPGQETRGLPTAHAAAPMNKRLFSAGSRIPVWPTQLGDQVGYSISPLHPGAPRAALADPTLYGILVMIDSMRVGRARETSVASELLCEALKMPPGWPSR
ncbi:hypothetical protein IFT48_01215 [Pseudomonas fluorescens]|uniref:hypothetical protein n=1 Tax=Pseudomonas TaxID=286 RepID=UPI000F037084|nr:MULTISPECIES: hypothetical protein [Pseudomonas]MBD8088593.1 hypothetical protein [Pseudomonas fluorescens]